MWGAKQKDVFSTYTQSSSYILWTAQATQVRGSPRVSIVTGWHYDHIMQPLVSTGCPPNINIAPVTSHDIYFTFSSSETRYEWDDSTWGTFQCHVSLIWSILQYLNSRVNDILTTQWEVMMVGDLCHPDRTFTFSEQMLQLVSKTIFTWLITNSPKFVVLNQ